MEAITETIENKLLAAFDEEFSFIKDKFEIMNLLGNSSPMDYEVIEFLKLPSEENNIVGIPASIFLSAIIQFIEWG